MAHLQDTTAAPGSSEQLRRDALEKLERIDTHISSVYLDTKNVYKLKKPVDFGFLDFSTLERRERACLAEVALNTRLTQGVYLGVLPVVDEQNDIVDWAVHMRRLDEAHRADRLLASGQLRATDIDRVARRLARFHDEARCDKATAPYGEVTTVERNVSENFEQTEGWLHEYLDAAEQREIENWQLRFLADNEGLFHRRAGDGRSRDGHGDLRLEHIYFESAPRVEAPSTETVSPDGLQIVDCIEFNERFRFGDVAIDVAFLAMDLAWSGAPLLAERFLSTYAQESNDYEMYGLIDFYESYRAFVRGKIAAFVAHDKSVDVRARQRAHEEARRYFRLAVAAERRRLQSPAVIAVGGLIASGKSTVARYVGEELGAPVVSADRTRKFLSGVNAETSLADEPFQGAYDEAFSDKVYAEMLRRARIVLRSGRPVVLDASFRSTAMRQEARQLARAERVPFHFLQCTAPRAVLLERLGDREDRALETDARADLLDAFEARWEPVVEISPHEAFWVDTTEPLDALAERLASALALVPHDLP